MTQQHRRGPVQMSFEPTTVRVPLAVIQPLRITPDRVRQTIKYGQIAASIREVGIIEPPIIVRDRSETGKFLLLDGHLRLDVLKGLRETEVVCLVATEDEAYTYNKRISRLATIQEHRMIVTAVERGVPEEKLARALNLSMSSIRQKFRLLDGICPETVDLLRDKHVPLHVFTELRRMKAVRQIEAARLMVLLNKFSIAYAKSLVLGSTEDELVERKTVKHTKGATPEQVALMERESESLDREVRAIERTYGADNLALVVGSGFVAKLLGSAAVVRYLAQYHPELLSEFQKVAEPDVAAA